MNPILMNKRLYIVFFLISQFMMGNSLFAQNGNLKPLDRKKWNELVNELKRKRYDAKEREINYDTKEIEFSDPDGEYGDYQSGGSGYNSNSGDGGIYSSSNDDDTFFDESNDRNGTSSEGSNDDLNPKYDDPNEHGDVSTEREYSEGTRDNSRTYRDYERDVAPIRNDTKSSVDSAAGGGSSLWLIIILVGVLAAAVIYMIMVSYKEGNKKVVVPESTLEKIENMTITKSELELALEAALKDKNYREATRIYFIAVIKEMKDRSWIRWEKKKTNYHYINEITGRPQQPDFVTATRAFEIVWYGNRTMAESDYYQVEPLFKRLLTSIR